ncbi:MAG: hypothetical protein NTX50_30850 [Candidatus Sumerlaeota bacterium]|nr:hypothetical protein [Candidatus Sumerlaeota bacterium]
MHTQNETHSPLLLEVLERVRSIEDTLSSMAKRRRVDPAWYTLDEASRLCGRSKRGLQSFLARNAADPNGSHPRRAHGRVFKQDFERLLESKQKVSRGKQVRDAVNNLLGQGGFQS